MPYGGSQWNYGMSQIISTLDENMNKIWGKHQLAFGGRYRHERFGYLSDRSPDQIAFTNLATAVYDPTTGANYGAKPNTGYADADFFLGAASSYSQNKNAPFNHTRLAGVRLLHPGQFPGEQPAHDQPGLRWEMHPAPARRKDYIVTFDMKNNALVLPQAALLLSSTKGSPRRRS